MVNMRGRWKIFIYREVTFYFNLYFGFIHLSAGYLTNFGLDFHEMLRREDRHDIGLWISTTI